LLSVEEHLAACLSAARPLPAADVGLLDALGCRLARDVTSEVDLPPFDNSAMDGYAVRVADVAGASPERPAVLPVVADVPAGPTERRELSRGTCVGIMTGAPGPAGTPAVVPVVWTDAGTSTVEIRRPTGQGAHVRCVGEDVVRGHVVLPAGTLLSARKICLLAAVGRSRVQVVPRPRVVVISTGSELLAPGHPLRYGQVYDANGYGLTAAATQAGCVARHVGAVADDPPAFAALLEAELGEADVVVTSGGVSAGAYEVVKDALGGLGTVTFRKVAMAPGMPQGFGTVGAGSTPIFTLPGNPVSSMVSFELFVVPVLRRLMGAEPGSRPAVRARAAVGWSSPAGKRQFVRAVLEDPGEGVLRVRPLGGQGSHLVADLATASCLAVVPEDVVAVGAGEELECLLLDRAW